MRVLAAVTLLALAAARPARAQDVATATRFEISTADSTFTFRSGANPWVKKGQHGIAVDPRRRDMLVARFALIALDSGRATALVTGATTRVTPEHVALLERPGTPKWRQRSFWLGSVVGALAGVLIGRAI